jgi:hypothetical protein
MSRLLKNVTHIKHKIPIYIVFLGGLEIDNLILYSIWLPLVDIQTVEYIQYMYISIQYTYIYVQYIYL